MGGDAESWCARGTWSFMRGRAEPGIVRGGPLLTFLKVDVVMRRGRRAAGSQHRRRLPEAPPRRAPVRRRAVRRSCSGHHRIPTRTYSALPGWAAANRSANVQCGAVVLLGGAGVLGRHRQVAEPVVADPRCRADIGRCRGRRGVGGANSSVMRARNRPSRPGVFCVPAMCVGRSTCWSRRPIACPAAHRSRSRGCYPGWRPRTTRRCPG